jgi:hypothetical protein
MEAMLTLFISSGCEAEFNNHPIMTDTSITFPADILHFEWQWDQIDVANFMDTAEIPSELSRLAEGGITSPTLADLQFLAITKQKIGEMVKPENWGLTNIHTIGSGILGFGVIIIIIYAAYRCYKWKFSSTSSAAPSPSWITIINTPTVPDRSASMESDKSTPHPLASTRYFCWSPRSQPRKKTFVCLVNAFFLILHALASFMSLANVSEVVLCTKHTFCA